MKTGVNSTGRALQERRAQAWYKCRQATVLAEPKAGVDKHTKNGIPIWSPRGWALPTAILNFANANKKQGNPIWLSLGWACIGDKQYLTPKCHEVFSSRQTWSSN